MNINLFHYLNNLAGANPWFDKLVVFFAGTFGILVVIFVLFFLIFHQDNKDNFEFAWKAFVKRVKEISLFFVGGVSAWILAQILKAVFAMPRPFIALPDVHLLINETGFDSFPSGHATFFAALATSIYFYHTEGSERSRGKKLGLILGFFALLIGLARIIAGIHFPIDILAGYLLGILVALFFKKI